MMRFSNQNVTLEFDSMGRLLRLENPESGRNYLAADGCELFRLTLVETFEGKVARTPPINAGNGKRSKMRKKRRYTLSFLFAAGWICY